MCRTLLYPTGDGLCKLQGCEGDQYNPATVADRGRLPSQSGPVTQEAQKGCPAIRET